MFYEKSKAMVLKWEGKENMGFVESMVCSWVAGGCASTITNPLDQAKLRLQVQRAGKSQNKQAFKYNGFFDALIQIQKQEGFTGLFKGSIARCCFHIPMTAIAMTTVE